jgi:peptide/nickel transport system substrate-binding protein
MVDALRNNGGGPLHCAVPGLLERALAGTIDRRSFLRTAAWLGVSVSSAKAMLAAVAPEPAEAEPAQPTPRQGGVLRFVCVVQQIGDPALTAWVEASNLMRNALEFLTYVDADNVTHPYLAESWTPSADLKTWAFTLRQGVKWSNGDDFTTEDVAFNINRWIAPGSQSSNRTAFAAIRAFETIDDHRFILHLDRPLCALPEMLYSFTCPIVHRRFEAEGGDWPKNPVGTGPFALTEYKVARIAKFRRRPDYWGEPAYLDEIHYVDLGSEIATHIAALAAGQVDVLYRVTIAELELVRRLANVRLYEEQSAQTLVLRMQHDHPPFDDIRIRRAIVLAADNAQMLRLAYRDMGVVGENFHVAPFQPDYAKLPPVARDVAKAKALLAEAGYPDGIDVTLALGNTQGRWEQDTAQVLQQNLLEAGIRLDLNVMPATEYWSIWNKVPFGVTYWSHRPLGIQILDICYRTGSAWNESHFASPEFDAAVDRAQAVLDPHERSRAMAAAEQILQDQAVMVQPYWGNNFTAASDSVMGHRGNPSHYYRMDKVWLA